MIASASMARESDPITRADVHPPHLAAQDPIAAVVTAVVAILGAFRVGERLGLTADEVLMIVGALGTIATIVRTWLERRNAGNVVAMAEQREQAAHRAGILKPQPRLVERMGKRGEGGELELVDLDKVPTFPAPEDTVERRG